MLGSDSTLAFNFLRGGQAASSSGLYWLRASRRTATAKSAYVTCSMPHIHTHCIINHILDGKSLTFSPTIQPELFLRTASVSFFRVMGRWTSVSAFIASACNALHNGNLLQHWELAFLAGSCSQKNLDILFHVSSVVLRMSSEALISSSLFPHRSIVVLMHHDVLVLILRFLATIESHYICWRGTLLLCRWFWAQFLRTLILEFQIQSLE